MSRRLAFASGLKLTSLESLFVELNRARMICSVQFDDFFDHAGLELFQPEHLGLLPDPDFAFCQLLANERFKLASDILGALLG
jgi:hypothetical protein